MIPTDPQQAVTLARALDTSPDILTALTLSPLPFVREAALSNLLTPLSAAIAVVPKSLNSPGEIGIAKAIASRPDATESLLFSVLSLFGPSQLDGARRENWPCEQLAVALLIHPNCSARATIALCNKVRLPKNLRATVLSSASNPAVREAVLNGAGT
jgi:hypothetical protein